MTCQLTATMSAVRRSMRRIPAANFLKISAPVKQGIVLMHVAFLWQFSESFHETCPT